VTPGGSGPSETSRTGQGVFAAAAETAPTVNNKSGSNVFRSGVQPISFTSMRDSVGETTDPVGTVGKTSTNCAKMSESLRQNDFGKITGGNRSLKGNSDGICVVCGSKRIEADASDMSPVSLAESGGSWDCSTRTLAAVAVAVAVATVFDDVAVATVFDDVAFAAVFEMSALGVSTV